MNQAKADHAAWTTFYEARTFMTIRADPSPG